MLKSIKNIFSIIVLVIFIFFIIKYYFSDKNILYMNKSRSSYALSDGIDLPLLENDTNNIIIYNNDLEEFKKKRKKRFWEKLITNTNE